MSIDDLDKILLSEKQIDASPSFAAEVMTRVEAEAALMRPRAFPRIRFALAMVVLMITTVWIFPTLSVLRALNAAAYTLGQWMIAPPDMVLWNAFAAALGSVLGTLLLLWLSLRLCETKS